MSLTREFLNEHYLAFRNARSELARTHVKINEGFPPTPDIGCRFAKSYLENQSHLHEEVRTTGANFLNLAKLYMLQVSDIEVELKRDIPCRMCNCLFAIIPMEAVNYLFMCRKTDTPIDFTMVLTQTINDRFLSVPCLDFLPVLKICAQSKINTGKNPLSDDDFAYIKPYFEEFRNNVQYNTLTPEGKQFVTALSDFY